MASIFTRIVNGEIPCYKIYEDDLYFAFLDIHPLSVGHTLVIPKKETDYLFDIDDSILAGMMLVAKKIALAQKSAIPCLRIGMAVLGLEVPHAHIHLVPLQSERDLNFSNPKLKISPDEFEKTAENIRTFIR